MTTTTRGLAVLALALLIGGWHASAAAEPSATTITVPDLDCASCAKKVGGKVAEVPGVAKVEYSIEAKTLKVTPKTGAAPSPKALWEAVEKGGKSPSRLEGPGGTFTAKPKN
jgi:copper chaperone CopZ